jgi:hypothetical protein
MKQNVLIISCIFGNKFKRVYPAPFSSNCYFFSNNMMLKTEVEKKGWKFIFVDSKLSSDNITSSLQSKYIKFLIFLNDYPEFKKYKQILYFDHKVFIKENDVDALIDILNENDNDKYNIIIRKHENYRKNIWSEVEEAKKQERYNKNMNKTITFINEKINKNEITADVDICNTGLILYNNYDDILPMLNDIYNTCIKLEQPECQIIWSIYSQKYSNKIKLIEFDYVKPLWKEPFTNRINKSNANNENNVNTTSYSYTDYFMYLLFVLIMLCIIYIFFNPIYSLKKIDVYKIIKNKLHIKS